MTQYISNTTQNKPVTWGLTPKTNQPLIPGATKTSTALGTSVKQPYKAPATTSYAGTTAPPKTPTPTTGFQPVPQSSTLANAGVTTPTNPLTTTPPVQQNQFRGLYPDVVSSLAKPKPPKETKRGMDAYEKAVEYERALKESVAKKMGDIYDSPVSATTMQGRAAAQQQADLEKLTAAKEAVTQQQNLIGFGQTQQSLNQASQISAAGFAQPSVAQYGQTVFNPLTGTYSGGQGNLDPQSVANNLANEVKAGRMTYEQAVQSLGYAGGAGQQFLNSALGSGFNIPMSSATIAGQAGVLGQMPALESADIASQGIKDKIVTYLADNPKLNPSDLAKGNVLSQWVNRELITDPKYQTLFNYLNEYTNTLAPILGVGGDTTNLKTEIAQSFINAAASGQSIAEVLENIQGLSQGKLQDIRSGAMGGGVVSSPSSYSSSGGGEGGLYNW